MFWARAIYHVDRAYWIKPQDSYKVARVETLLRGSTPKPCIFCLLPNNFVYRGEPLGSLSAKNAACPAHNLWHTPASEPAFITTLVPAPGIAYLLVRPSLDPSPRRRPDPDPCWNSRSRDRPLSTRQFFYSVSASPHPASIPKSAIPPTFSPP
jgi:hypothetical protein